MFRGLRRSPPRWRATRIGALRFIVYDGIGAALWAAGAVALGAIFHDAVSVVLLTLEAARNYALLLLALAVALFIAGRSGASAVAS